MTKMKLHTIMGMLFGSLFLVSHNASAATWSSAGSVCEPGSDSIGLFAFSGAKYQFGGSNTGEIRTRCGITNPLDSGNPTWTTMVVGYQDQDGTGIGDQVVVQLIKVDKSSGVATIIKNFSSNGFSNTGAQSRSVTFTHTFDFDANAYYIAATLDRVDATNNPSFFFVQLK